jgi:Ca-activated chloride channel family protein
MVLLLLMCAGADPALALDVGSAAHGQQAWGEALGLDTDIHVEVSGVVARTRVRQRFRNHAGQWVEGQYSYPLPEDSAVDELEVRAGSRVIVGEIREREAARQGYRQARDSGIRAALVEQGRPNLFETRIANIGPGDDVEVRIGYQLILQLEGGVQELRLPLAVTPRFSPMEALEKPQPARAGGAPGHARLSLTIHYPGPLLELESPGHDIQVLDLGERKELTVSLGADAASKDFILRWRYAPQQPEPLLFTETLGGQQFGLLVFYPPEQASTVAIPRDLVLVIDTSGSMEGAPMEQAKAALGLAIASLSPRDRFNVIQFNDRAEALFQRSMPATAWYRGQAENYIRYLAASGGTMMAPALEVALEGNPEPGVLRQVVFVTDGAVANEEELFEIVASKLGDTRLFTVGIGPAPNGYFMQRAARLGRGSSVRVPEMSALRRGMQVLFRKLEHPAVMDIAIRAQDGTDLLQGHGPLADLYVGEPVLATFRIPRDAGLITVTGLSDGASWMRQIKPAPRSHPGIARLWGRHRISELQMGLSRGADRAQARAAMTSVALEVGLVSAYTSLVAIDNSRARADSQALTSLGVPMPLADGSVAQAAYPQTGLGLMGQWLAALLGLGGAGVMWRIRP